MIRVRRTRGGRNEENLNAGANCGAYFRRRIETKDFRWGRAETCLAQFTQEAYLFAPNNEMLSYEGTGLTTDGRYSVFFEFAVQHPRLPGNAARARVYQGPGLHRFDADPDLRRLDEFPAGDFAPSLSRIDALIGSLEIRD